MSIVTESEMISSRCEDDSSYATSVNITKAFPITATEQFRELVRNLPSIKYNSFFDPGLLDVVLRSENHRFS